MAKKTTCHLCGASFKEDQAISCPVCNTSLTGTGRETLQRSDPCDYVSGVLSIKQGTAYLTDKRIFFKTDGGKMLFSLPLEDIALSEDHSHGVGIRKGFKLHTKDGSTYKMLFMFVKSGRKEWGELLPNYAPTK